VSAQGGRILNRALPPHDICFEPIEDFVRGRHAPGISIREPASKGRVERCKMILAFLDETNAFPQHFTFRIVAARLHELRDKSLELRARSTVSGILATP
jgi:hypothetical protein